MELELLRLYRRLIPRNSLLDLAPIFQGGARDALSLLDLMMGVRALALLASVFVTLTN